MSEENNFPKFDPTFYDRKVIKTFHTHDGVESEIPYRVWLDLDDPQNTRMEQCVIKPDAFLVSMKEYPTLTIAVINEESYIRASPLYTSSDLCDIVPLFR